MAKKLDPQEIEQSRRKKTRADNREERKERIHDGIRKNRESGGVIIIPPPPAVQAQGQTPRKMRVAAYVRVSTQEEQQVGSFEMQIVYFKSKIESNPDWELVKIYQDYGVSGTSTNKRQGFKDMIDDAKAGKIDLILTKGINRFGRNTVDILNNLRTLNALTPPVPVRFESEGLSSIGDGSNNLLIAVLSALAELESQQKSEAIKNGIRWRMALSLERVTVNRFGIACSLADLPGSGFSSKICCTFCQSDFFMIAVWCSSLKYLLSIVFFTDLCSRKSIVQVFCMSASPQYFSFRRIPRIVAARQKSFPLGDLMPCSVSAAAISAGVAPSKQLS